MTPRKASATEAKLDSLRTEAERRGPAQPPSASRDLPTPGREHGYYGQPIVKPPVWTWEIPLYFFAGGTAGAAAVIAAIAHLVRPDPGLERTALAMACVLALASPPLLISDLGRPERFLNMLRVFKIRSPMSVGAWVLAAFTPAVLVALGANLFPDSLLFRSSGIAALWLAACLGLVLATYTGVLLGATAIPAWNTHRALLPVHFAASALGSAAGLLELCGFLTPATLRLGITAAAIETGIGALIELRPRRPDRALREGRSGRVIRLGAILSGPLPLVLRIAGAESPLVRLAAAIAFLAGALLSRYGWLAVGRRSAGDLQALFAAQHQGHPGRREV